MIIYYTLLILSGISVCFFRFAYYIDHKSNVLKQVRWPNIGSFFVWAGGLSLILLCVNAFLLQRFTIPSKSMLPNLTVGQVVHVKPNAFGIVNPFTLAKVTSSDTVIGYGDIVTARFPYSSDVQYIKRVVGRAGDVISISPSGIILNNKLFPFVKHEEKKTNNSSHAINLKGNTYDVLIDDDSPFLALENYHIPEGTVFLLGDNLTGSVDSRELGGFAISNITGRVY